MRLSGELTVLLGASKSVVLGIEKRDWSAIAGLQTFLLPAPNMTGERSGTFFALQEKTGYQGKAMRMLLVRKERG
jgi:hypothetical protein